MARTHVILPADLLEAIDRRVGPRSRSRFLEEAAREKLARQELKDALEATAGIASSERYPHWRDLDSIKEWVRKTRRTEPTP